jgi:hypothetical protein
MIEEELKELEITSLEDIVTAADLADIKSNYAQILKGVRRSQGGALATKDFGTKGRYAGYPDVKIHDVFNIYDKLTGTTYDLMIGLDGSNNMYVYVNDATLAAQNRNKRCSNQEWIDSTFSFGTTINSATGSTLVIAASTTYTDELAYWIAVNGSKYSLVLSSVAGATTSCTMLHNVQTLGWTGSVTFYRQLGTLNGYTWSNGAYPHIRWNDNESLTKIVMYYGSAASFDAAPTQRKPLCFRRYNASRGFFYRDSSALLTLPSDWYAELQGGGLLPDYQTVGSPTSPNNAASYTFSATGCDGTIATWTTTTLTGALTNFTSKLKIGQMIWQVETGQARQVIRVNNNTECIIDYAFDANPSTNYTWGVGTGVNSANITDNNLVGITITAEAQDEVEADLQNTVGLRVLVTVVYEGYQESDPIYRAYFIAGTWALMTQRWADIALGLQVDPSRLNRNISALRVYCAKTDSSAYSNYADWPEADSDYILMYEAKMNEAPSQSRHWTLTNTDQTCFSFAVPTITKSYYKSKVGSITLAGALAHASDTTRSYLTPRFGARVARGGGVGIVAVDQDDFTLRLSSYDGYAFHNDDNFPDVATDSNKLRQKISLTARGELIGLDVVNDMLVAIKRTEIELVDLQSGSQRVVKEDVLSRKSIVKGKKGLYWAGKSGLRLLPNDGTEIKTINPLWVNLYNGDLRTADNVYPRVADTDRNQIIAGSDPLYDQVWFYLPTRREDGTVEYLCHRFDETTELWESRELNIGTNKTVQGFCTRKDNTFSIFYGHSTSSRGILQYPNRAGNFYWEDDVTSADVSASKGIPLRIRFNCGEIYSIRQDKTLYDAIMDFSSSLKTGQNGFIIMKLYANGETMPFDTEYFRVDGYGETRFLEPRSNIEQLEVEIMLQEGNELAFKEFELSTLSLRFQARIRLGKP